MVRGLSTDVMSTTTYTKWFKHKAKFDREVAAYKHLKGKWYVCKLYEVNKEERSIIIELLPDKPDADDMDQIREIVDDMWASGFMHGDFKLKNMGKTADGVVKVYDFDRSKFITKDDYKKLNVLKL